MKLPHPDNKNDKNNQNSFNLNFDNYKTWQVSAKAKRLSYTIFYSIIFIPILLIILIFTLGDGSKPYFYILAIIISVVIYVSYNSNTSLLSSLILPAIRIARKKIPCKIFIYPNINILRLIYSKRQSKDYDINGLAFSLTDKEKYKIFVLYNRLYKRNGGIFYRKILGIISHPVQVSWSKKDLAEIGESLKKAGAEDRSYSENINIFDILL